MKIRKSNRSKDLSKLHPNNLAFIKLRKKLNLTQAQFAAKFDLHLRTIGRWEQGYRNISDSKLKLFRMAIKSLE